MRSRRWLSERVSSLSASKSVCVRVLTSAVEMNKVENWTGKKYIKVKIEEVFESKLQNENKKIAFAVVCLSVIEGAYVYWKKCMFLKLLELYIFQDNINNNLVQSSSVLVSVKRDTRLQFIFVVEKLKQKQNNMNLTLKRW